MNDTQKKTMMLKPEAILRYLVSDDDYVDTLIMCRGSEVDLVATDSDIYEALGSIKSHDRFNMNKLKKFFEVVHVYSSEKKILKDERVDEIRKLALREDKNGKENSVRNK